MGIRLQIEKHGITNIFELKSEELMKHNSFFTSLINAIKSSSFYLKRLSKYLNGYETYMKNSVEKRYETFEKYQNKIFEYLNLDSDKLSQILHEVERFSFNMDCIPDESLLILDVLCLRKAKVYFQFNRLICHICNKCINIIPKIILSNCCHCYCNDCMEIFCMRATSNTMKSSNYLMRKCMIADCNELISKEDAEKCGKMY